MQSTEGKVVVLGVTGASGAILAQAALRKLEADSRVAYIHLVVTETGGRLLAHELGITGEARQIPALLLGSPARKTGVLPNKDVGASIASGSYPVDAMLVIPCSMGALASIATGASNDLLSRAADVCLKENRRLVLCLRDTPFSRIHLENMLRAQQAGALIMPVIPAFYHQPRTIDDLVEQFVNRALAQLGLRQPGAFRWEGQQPAAGDPAATGERIRPIEGKTLRKLRGPKRGS
ncbi:MAG: UbiX family flavin prenyltransferase [Candidatus Acidiferrales bacterium]